MIRTRGFTLLETLISTSILSGALIAAASVFSFSIATNLTNQQRTVATLLLCSKIEQFRATALSDPLWTPGEYFDFASVGADGSLTTSPTNSALPYMRLWQVSGAVPRTVIVIVVANRAGLTNSRWS